MCIILCARLDLPRSSDTCMWIWVCGSMCVGGISKTKEPIPISLFRQLRSKIINKSETRLEIRFAFGERRQAQGILAAGIVRRKGEIEIDSTWNKIKTYAVGYTKLGFPASGLFQCINGNSSIEIVWPLWKRLKDVEESEQSHKGMFPRVAYSFI